MLRLGRFNGRVGNQIGQYGLARSVASRFGCRLEVPWWLGRSVFDPACVDDPYPTAVKLEALPFDTVPTSPGYEFSGYFQHQAAFDVVRRSQLKQWLRIRPCWLERCPKPKPFYVAAHLRRGDYLKHRGKYAVVLKTAFKKAITAAGYALADVIWVSESEPGGRASDWPPGLSFLHDFLVLSQADVVFRANSTFSQWAAILGEAQEVWSPRVGERVGEVDDVLFERGNHCAHVSATIHKINGQFTDMVLPD